MAISELPICSGRRAARVFVEFGWEIRRVCWIKKVKEGVRL